jgi:hypothetical protein
MAKQSKTPVSRRAVVQRLQRKLARGGEVLVATRSGRWRGEMGEYHVVDTRRGAVVAKGFDLEEWAREQGALREWERMVD